MGFNSGFKGLILCSVDRASLYNIVNKANLVQNLFLVYLSICTCFGQPCAHHQEKQLCLCDTCYLLFCVDDCLLCRVEFHPAYRKYMVLVIVCGWLSGMQGGIPPCIPEVLGTCYSLWMTVWYAGWNSTLHTGSTRYLLFCVDDCLVCRVEFHLAYQKYSVLVILCWWLWYVGWNSTLHTRQSSTQNNKYRVSHKRRCFSWWWAHGRPKHVEIDKHTKNKLCSKLALFTRLCGV